jgi:uncharacterized damage-inducible protein DinB
MLAEIKAYIETLQELRSQVARIVKDVPADGLNWRPPLPESADPTNSLGVLAYHVAGSEHGWMAETLAGYPKTRVREDEFKYVANSASKALEPLAAVAKETEEILSKLTVDQLDGAIEKDGKNLPLRWIIHHVIYHYALHVGHMQLTYQLWNRGMAATSPRWFDRIPKSS